MQKRCEWANDTPLKEYHDKEWGVPLHNDKKLFEFLILDGAQAGLPGLQFSKKEMRIEKPLTASTQKKLHYIPGLMCGDC